MRLTHKLEERKNNKTHALVLAQFSINFSFERMEVLPSSTLIFGKFLLNSVAIDSQACTMDLQY